MTLGWVGAPNERAPLRVHDAIAVFAVRCLTRTRIADQAFGGVNKHCAGFAHATKFRVSCPGHFKFFPCWRLLCLFPCFCFSFACRITAGDANRSVSLSLVASVSELACFPLFGLLLLFVIFFGASVALYFLCILFIRAKRVSNCYIQEKKN